MRRAVKRLLFRVFIHWPMVFSVIVIGAVLWVPVKLAKRWLSQFDTDVEPMSTSELEAAYKAPDSPSTPRH